MSEWIDVPVAEVAVGDEARINGYGRREVTGELVDVGGAQWRAVLYVDGSEVGTSAVDYDARFRRSSIVAARRRKPEPQPKPGDWDCKDGNAHRYELPYTGEPKPPCPACRVYRASGGWSRDTRTGRPWVIKTGVEVVATGWGYQIDVTGNNATAFWGHKYKVTGVDSARSGYWILDCQIIGPHSIHARNLDLIDRRGKR